MTTKQHLLLVHGRDFKPELSVLLDISISALRAGLERDFPDQISAFDALSKDIVWYGDLNAKVLSAAGKRYDEQLDIGDRRNALAALLEIPARKKFSIRRYDCLPGKTAIPEFIANIAAPVMGAVGMSTPLIGSIAKDVFRYFKKEESFAAEVRERLLEKLAVIFDRNENVVLLTHGTGCVVAYDVLWQLSHDPDLKKIYGAKKIGMWITLGAPLGDSGVRKRLLGAQEKPPSKYPTNVICWHNVSAEDDYTCHDNTLADDYRPMMQRRLVSAVHDHKIYNLAVRYGKSNPHSSVGYYVHPRVSKILSDWLRPDPSRSDTSGPTR